MNFKEKTWPLCEVKWDSEKLLLSQSNPLMASLSPLGCQSGVSSLGNIFWSSMDLHWLRCDSTRQETRAETALSDTDTHQHICNQGWTPYHLPFFLKNKRLPCSLPKSQRFVMGRWYNIVPTGAYSQAPYFLVMSLRRERTKNKNPE